MVLSGGGEGDRAVGVGEVEWAEMSNDPEWYMKVGEKDFINNLSSGRELSEERLGNIPLDWEWDQAI